MDTATCTANLGFPTYLWWGMPDVLEPRISFEEALHKVEVLGFTYTDLYLQRKDLYELDMQNAVTGYLVCRGVLANRRL